jgi:Na+-driven multidrug efflux pump
MVLFGMGTLRGIRQVIDRGMRAAHVTSTGVMGEAVALIASLVFATVGHSFAGLLGLAVGLAVAQGLACLAMLFTVAKHFELKALDFWPLQAANIADVRRFLRT